MDKMESFIYSVSRFVFGLGIGLALTSVYVIVSSGPDLLGPRQAGADIVRLEPVIVTISAERFAAIESQALQAQAAATTHVYGSGPLKV